MTAAAEIRESTFLQGLRRYVNDADLRALASVRIGIAGAGGLGSNCALFLARSGIRHLTLIDSDVVEPSNLNRQQYFPEDVGMPKVEALRRLLLRLDAQLDLTVYQACITAENAPGLFAGCDIVVEAFDVPEAKAMLCNALRSHVKLLVCASGLAGVGGPPMLTRRLGPNLLCVGDFTTSISKDTPPMAPRVSEAAALQADAVLHFLLEGKQNCSLDGAK